MDKKHSEIITNISLSDVNWTCEGMLVYNLHLNKRLNIYHHKRSRLKFFVNKMTVVSLSVCTSYHQSTCIKKTLWLTLKSGCLT